MRVPALVENKRGLKLFEAIVIAICCCKGCPKSFKNTQKILYGEENTCLDFFCPEKNAEIIVRFYIVLKPTLEIENKKVYYS